jgi:hypothetical protein
VHEHRGGSTRRAKLRKKAGAAAGLSEGKGGDAGRWESRGVAAAFITTAKGVFACVPRAQRSYGSWSDSVGSESVRGGRWTLRRVPPSSEGVRGEERGKGGLGQEIELS